MICIRLRKQQRNTGSCHNSHVQIAMVERPEEERDGQGNGGSRVSQAHPSPWPCAASSQDARVSSSCSVLDFFCFEEPDDTFSTAKTEVMTYLRTAETGKTISHNKGNFSEEKRSYSIQCTS